MVGVTVGVGVSAGVGVLVGRGVGCGVFVAEATSCVGEGMHAVKTINCSETTRFKVLICFPSHRL